MAMSGSSVTVYSHMAIYCIVLCLVTRSCHKMSYWQGLDWEEKPGNSQRLNREGQELERDTRDTRQAPDTAKRTHKAR